MVTPESGLLSAADLRPGPSYSVCLPWTPQRPAPPPQRAFLLRN